jgi:hypothetical protein
MPIPSGTIPAKDFNSSKAFYESIGFKKLLDGDMAIFAAGQTAFILQRLYDESWAKFTKMQLMVDDLDNGGGTSNRSTSKKFGVQPPKPRLCNRGDSELRVSTILRHVAQLRENAPSD